MTKDPTDDRQTDGEKMQDTLKKQHEFAVGEKFAGAYGRQFGVHLTFHSQQESPDLTYCTSEGRAIGLEIVTAYYNDLDAAKRWSNARGRQHTPATAVENPDLSLRERVEREVAKKCLMRYAAPCWLVIDANAPLTDERDLLALHSVQLPANPPFESIFVCVAGSDGAYVLGQLHPSVGVRAS